MIRVSPDELRIIQGILHQHAPDCEVRAFGSRYKCTNKDYSDLDLAFLRNDGEKLPLMEFADLKDAFMESDLPYRVDVVDYYAASEGFRAVIDAGYEKIWPKS